MNSKLYPLGLALGGGGARGFAHLGVAQALAEAGLRPDIISGTSAGSIVGAMLASGHTPLECMELFAHMKMRHLAKPAVSRKGFLEYSHLEEELETFIGVRTFEELKIPLVVTASDMNTAQPVHFRTGELLPCIIASCSIPVVFVPRATYDANPGDYAVYTGITPVEPGAEWLLVHSTGMGISQNFATLFAYPQVHIEQRLIPQIEAHPE